MTREVGHTPVLAIVTAVLAVLATATIVVFVSGLPPEDLALIGGFVGLIE